MRGRKNLFLPCGLNARVKEMTNEEFAKALRDNDWVDVLSTGAWNAILGHEGADRAAKSRAKKRVASWLVAFAHIVDDFAPEFALATVERAVEVYEEQFGRESFTLQTLRNIAMARTAQDRNGGVVRSQVWRAENEEEL
jgi:hypothetical protein